jgi:MFS family permease
MFHHGGMAIRGLIRAVPGAPRQQATRAGGRPGGHRAVLAVVSVAQFLIALDYSIVYLALPGITRALALPPALAQWVLSAYAVLFAGFLVVGGRLADRFGPARMFVIAITVFGAASGAGAAAGDGAVLLAARAAQGLGAALLQPAILGLIGTRFAAGPPRARAQATWAAVGAAGLAAGALLGGLLTTASWRLTLLVNVPPALGCALVAVGWERSPAPVNDKQDETARRVPVLSSALCTASVLALTMGLTFGGALGWTSAPALGCLPGALAAFAWFTRNEMTAGSPLIEPALRRARSLRAGAVAAALYMASVGSEFYLLTLLLQTLWHYSPLRAGLAFLPLAVMVTAGSLAAGRVDPLRSRPRLALAAGFLIALAGLAWLSAALVLAGPHPGGYATSLLPGLLLSGLGHGVIYTAMFILGPGDLPARHQGTAGALMTTAQYLSGALTLAVLTLILGRSPGSPGYAAAFLAITAAAGAGALLAVTRRVTFRTR